MCTKENLEHNLNRTMIEATRLFDRNPFIRLRRVSCIVCTAAEDASPRGALPPITLPAWLACTLHQRLIFRCVELHIDRNRQIPSAICKGELLLESRVVSVFVVPCQLTLETVEFFLVLFCRLIVEASCEAVMLKGEEKKRWEHGGSLPCDDHNIH